MHVHLLCFHVFCAAIAIISPLFFYYCKVFIMKTFVLTLLSNQSRPSEEPGSFQVITEDYSNCLLIQKSSITVLSDTMSLFFSLLVSNVLKPLLSTLTSKCTISQLIECTQKWLIELVLPGKLIYHYVPEKLEQGRPVTLCSSAGG